MKIFKNTLSALSVLVGLGGSAAMAQEDAPLTPVNDIAQNVADLASKINKCEVKEGVPQITLNNGDVIANSNWYYDSFSIGVRNPEGEGKILDPRTDEIINNTDICTRSDIELPPHKNVNLEPDIEKHEFACEAPRSGLSIDVIDLKSGSLIIGIESVTAEFHHVNGNDDILGSCEFMKEGQKIIAPILLPPA